MLTFSSKPIFFLNSNIDLVVSVLSVGFHYPIEDYIEVLKDITTKNAILVFGVRRGVYSVDSFKGQFENIALLKNLFVDTKEDILILEK